MKKAPERVLQVMSPTPPIRMGVQPRTGSSRLELASTLFLRAVAVLWFVEGAVQWLTVFTEPDSNFLSHVSAPHVTALFFFCILDFVAAVGLWLASTWGVAVWMATIAGHAAVAAFGSGVLSDPIVLVLSDVALVGVYAALEWLGARERRRR